MLLLLMKTFMAKFSCLFDFVKVPESPKYTKQRFCPVELNKNAKGVFREPPINHLKVIK
jgi:hypothetical protein